MFLDIGLGMLLGLGVSQWFDADAAPWFVAAGIVFSLLPDADFVAHLLRGGTSRDAYRHRELLHYPLLYITVAALIALFAGVPLASLFVLASLAHFIHDSIGIGWGVQWLYPFSKNHYTFLYRYHAPGKPAPAPRLVYVWRHDDVDRLNREHGDPDWINNIYLKWHPYAVVEFAVFAAAVLVLLLHAAGLL